MSDGAHLLIPFAACQANGCREAMDKLQLPQLQRLLGRLSVSASDDGDAASLSPPHERAIAAACGLASPDGCIPWAAWQVQQDGRNAANDAWAWITPCHWHVATDHIVMRHPQELGLTADESQALLAAMQPFFAQDGIALDYHTPTRWLARGELFRGLATASLDRVAGRDIDDWVPRAAAAAPLRRLQQEMQMLLYTHAVNDERLRSGMLPVNSFWASGTGALAPSHRPLPPERLEIPYGLRDAALMEDWNAWSDAWQQIDGTQCRALNDEIDEKRPAMLTLCGETAARSWCGPEIGLWRRFQRKIGRESLSGAVGVL